MKLSIIIPCLNEEATIKKALDKVLSVDLIEIQKEVIVVDDGSTDKSPEIIKGYNQIFSIFHPKRSGKGAAIKSAMPHVTGDFVIIQDADLEYDPADYVNLIKAAKENNASVIYGSRRLNKKNQWSHLSFLFGGIFLSKFTNLLFGSRITDQPTCYKLFKTSLLKSLNIKADGFEFCSEATAKTLRRGIKIYEVPISYNPRHVLEGKKISWKDGVIAIWTTLKYRFID